MAYVRRLDGAGAYRYECHGPEGPRIAGYGLGMTILLAGIHKLAVPTAWTVYLIEPVEPFLMVTPVQFMLINGILEIGFGVVLVANRGTRLAAGVVMNSLAGTAVYLSVVTLLRGGQFLDILIRDIGLTALAATVLIQQVDREQDSA